MRLAASSQLPPSDRRHRTAALLASLATFTLITAAVPIATATPVNALTAERAAVAKFADVTDIRDEAEQITFDDLRRLVEQFEGTGEVTFSGARRMLVFVDWAEFYHDKGYDSRAVLLLEHFKDVASDPVYVPSESAREQLIAAADQLIVQLGGTP